MVKSATDPLSRTLTGVANSSSDFWNGVFNAHRLAAQVRNLEAENRIVGLYAGTVARLQEEVDRLRKLQNYPEIPGKTKIRADVIGFFIRENRITVSAGSRQGVHVGLPVVASAGLVGTVQTVEPDECQVLLITAPRQANPIGAIINKDPEPWGLLHGEASDRLIVQFAADSGAGVKNGDLVVTSGFSDRIPRGIEIGRVVQVVDDPTMGEKRAQVFPSVQIGGLREVFIWK